MLQVVGGFAGTVGDSTGPGSSPGAEWLQGMGGHEGLGQLGSSWASHSGAMGPGGAIGGSIDGSGGVAMARGQPVPQVHGLTHLSFQRLSGVGSMPFSSTGGGSAGTSWGQTHSAHVDPPVSDLPFDQMLDPFQFSVEQHSHRPQSQQQQQEEQQLLVKQRQHLQHLSYLTAQSSHSLPSSAADANGPSLPSSGAVRSLFPERGSSSLVGGTGSQGKAASVQHRLPDLPSNEDELFSGVADGYDKAAGTSAARAPTLVVAHAVDHSAIAAGLQRSDQASPPLPTKDGDRDDGEGDADADDLFCSTGGMELETEGDRRGSGNGSAPASKVAACTALAASDRLPSREGRSTNQQGMSGGRLPAAAGGQEGVGAGSHERLLTSLSSSLDSVQVLGGGVMGSRLGSGESGTSGQVSRSLLISHVDSGISTVQFKALLEVRRMDGE